MNYLKQSFRNIWHKSSHFIINLSGLSIALTVFMLIMLYVVNEFNYDKSQANGQQIYRLEAGDENQLPLAISRIAKKNFPEIEEATVIKSFNNPWLRYDDNFYEVDDMCFAEGSFFEMFTIPFISGDYKTALDAPYSIVLCKSLAKKMFGDKNPIGERINFKGQDFYTVTGVIEDISDFHLPAKALASFKSAEDRYHLGDDTWNWGMISYFMLEENTNPKQLASKMDSFFTKMERLQGQSLNFSLRPFNSIYLATDSAPVDESKQGNLYLLIVLIIIGVLIIVIASINFINLIISQGLKKMQEVTVKRILGGSRMTIFFQYAFDSLVLCFSAILIASLFVFLTLNPYQNLIGKSLHYEQFLSFKYVLYALLFLATLVVIYGFFPAYFLTQKNIQQWKKDSKNVIKSQGLNNGLITFQYVVSIILIIGTAFIYRQLNYIQNEDLGFDDEQLLSVKLVPDMKNNLNSFKTQLLENPNIKGVSFASDDITQFNQYSNKITIDDKTVVVNYAEVDPDFIPLLDMKMVQGNNFSWNIKTQTNGGYILNKAAWDILKNTSLKDKNYNLDNRALIGVVENFHFESFHSQINPMILYWQKNIQYSNNALIKLSGNNTIQTLDYIEAVFHHSAPNDLYKCQFINQELDQLYRTEKTLVQLFCVFALLAVFIASLGIFSLSRLTAENKIKEIGIRKVNGAKISEILTMLNKDFVKWVVIAFIVATPIAWFAMNKWLENFAYKTTLSWWIFALAGLLALGIALLTVSWQSWKAATRNPVEALRYE
ncbi:FtsX-like permease family protein [Maribellus comscasis]|uniref:FtsX-like permease family protein n=1 Tax=Maribellus comscasis TaxID=2681766 RepID=A0A6I6JUA5_9BACT|nr:ABC transporter permease [Maribellus comscasis]QGY44650.1 FtsX-like permease family protein [Maribellus comscasis]